MAVKAPSVSVDLTVRWPTAGQYDVLQQASEFLADEDSLRGDAKQSLFWGFVDLTHELLEQGFSADTAEGAAQLAVTAASRLVQPLTVRVLRVSAAARSHAAAVEMHRELAATTSGRCATGADAWAVVLPGEQVVCDPSALSAAVASAASSSVEVTALGGAATAAEPPTSSTRLVADDHVRGAAPGDATATVVVYGVLGTPSLRAMHAEATVVATDGVAYALRHWAPPSPAGAASVVTRLSGWGAGLDVKNTEYKAVDDRAAAAAAPADDDAAEASADPDLHPEGVQSVTDAAGHSVSEAILSAQVAGDAGPGESLPASPVARATASQVLEALLRSHDQWRAVDASLPDAKAMHVKDVNATGIGIKTTAYIMQSAGRLDRAKHFNRERQLAIAEARQRVFSEAIEAKRARLERRAKRDGSPAPASVSLTNAERVRLSTLPVQGVETEAAAQARYDQQWLSSDTAPEAAQGLADPLVLLTHLTGNFPSAAAALSTAPLDQDVLRAAQSNGYSIPAGQNVVLVNGRSIDATAASFNFFSVLRTLQDEASVLAQFESLPLSDSDTRGLRAFAAGAGSGSRAARAPGSGGAGDAGGGASTDPVAAAEGGKASLRVDYRSGSEGVVLSLSDVERDPQFKRFQRSVKTLLTPAWQLHTVRRNLYNVLLLGDIASPGGLRAVLTAAYFAQQAQPVTFGVVPMVPEANAPTAELQPASDAYEQALKAATGPAEKAPGQHQDGVTADSSSATSRQLPEPEDPVDGLDLAILVYDAQARAGRNAARALLAALGSAWQQVLQETAAALQARAKTREEAQALMQAMDLNVPLSLTQALEAYSAAMQEVGADKGLGMFPGQALQEQAKEALADGTGRGRWRVLRARRWAASHGLPTPGHLVNGRPGAGLAVQESVMRLVQQEVRVLQALVQSTHLDDKKGSSALDLLLASEGAVPVFHEAALDTDTRPVVALAAPVASPLLWAVPFASAPDAADGAKAVTVHVLGDLNAESGLEAAENALASLVAHAADQQESSAQVGSKPSARVGLVHTGPLPVASESHPVSVAGIVTAGAGVMLSDASKSPLRFSDRALALLHVVRVARAALRAGADSAAARLVSQLKRGDSALCTRFPGAGCNLALAVMSRATSASGAARSAAAAEAASSSTRTAMPAPVAEASHGSAGDQGTLARVWADAKAARRAALRVVPRAWAPTSAPANALPQLEPDGSLRALLTNGRVVALAAAETLSPELVSAAVGAEARARGNGVLARLAQADILSILPDDDDDDDDAGAVADDGSNEEDENKDASPDSTSEGSGAASSAERAKHRAGPWAVRPDDATSDFTSGLVAAASSTLAVYAADGVRQRLPDEYLDGRTTSFLTVPHRSTGAAESSGVEVEALLDPVSAAAQRAAPLLLLLRDALGARVRVFLHPSANVQGTGEDSDRKLPLNSYYRFAGPGVTSAGFDTAHFDSLPPFLLTAKVYPPEPWDVQTDKAELDADNMQLVGAQRTRIQYSLRSLLLAGQCDEVSAASPPNGLQLQLGAVPGLPATASSGAAPVLPTSAGAGRGALADTLVMQNLGYFQLKAQPGVRAIALAPGRASDIFEIAIPEGAARDGRRPGEAKRGGLRRVGRAMPKLEGEGEEQEEELQGTPYLEVAVRDFAGDITQLRVRRRPGKEDAKLLVTEEEEAAEAEAAAAARGAVKGAGQAATGLWGSLTTMFGGSAGGSSTATAGNTSETMHVFSLASGHLYERFLKIMMLSVTKRASRPVKFWLVENFLSPQFKETIHKLAEHAGFEVAMVTYKWPNWLRGQTEKQRIIWGYKILFLDVLFPLGVDKVIYVDADQVVRADLAELWDMDLEGAPYGYTPFCTSRKETLGFQFWQQGYWKDHLKEKPYHISALYVVDLKRFRRQAVGDTLRSLYDQLSRDPNSLSNLDQDLPNYAQNAVPIKSLPQEWLWCESWCSDETKATSKTIDLCNNPLHKEPKLDMARRVISGDLFPESWVELDAEVAASEGREVDLDAARASVPKAPPAPQVPPGTGDKQDAAETPKGAKKARRKRKGRKRRGTSSL